MFLKIFKHAFTRPLKTVLPLLLICVIAGIVTGICQNLYSIAHAKYIELFDNSVTIAQNSRYRYLSSLLSVLSSALTLSIIIVIAFQLYVVYSSFKKAIATDEAYLTYTLPATSGQQTGARYLSLLAWNFIIFISAIITFTCLNAFSNGFDFQNVDKTPIKLDGESILYSIEVFILCLVIFASTVAHGQFGIVFSNALSLKLKRKISSFIVGFIFFFEIVFLLIVLVLALAINTSGNGSYPHFTVWFFTVLIGGLGGLAYSSSYKYMGRRLNVA